MRKLLLFFLLIPSLVSASPESEQCSKLFNESNSSKAFNVCSKAADQGEVNAQFHLGYMYDFGQGVTQDYKEAVKWYSKAAEQGDAEAQYYLGAKYAYGVGVIPDCLIAHMFLSLSAAQGDVNPKILLDTVSQEMTQSQIAEAQRMAREWMQKHQQ
jgi:uncharacterized protein